MSLPLRPSVTLLIVMSSLNSVAAISSVLIGASLICG